MASIIADVLIATAIVCTIIYVPISTSKIRRLEATTATVAQLRADNLSLEATLRRNIQSGGLEGQPLPSGLAAKIRRVFGQSLQGSFKNLLLFIYGPDVCERTLSEGLQSLARNDSLAENKGLTIAIVGVRSAADRERALLLQARGILRVPFVTVSVESLLAPAGFRHDTAVSQEPLLLRVDSQLTITAAFHVDQLRPHLLDEWLAATTR